MIKHKKKKKNYLCLKLYVIVLKNCHKLEVTL